MHVDAAAKADLEKAKQEFIAKGIVYYCISYMLSCTLTHTPKKKLSILKNPNMHNFTQN
jgi:hypothetical protein